MVRQLETCLAANPDCRNMYLSPLWKEILRLKEICRQDTYPASWGNAATATAMRRQHVCGIHRAKIPPTGVVGDYSPEVLSEVIGYASQRGPYAEFA
jgi:hypothetical protein